MPLKTKEEWTRQWIKDVDATVTDYFLAIQLNALEYAAEIVKDELAPSFNPDIELACTNNGIKCAFRKILSAAEELKKGEKV